MDKKRLTLNKVNAIVNPLGYELVRGKGYYYYTAMPDNGGVMLYQDGIYDGSILSDYTMKSMLNVLYNKLTDTMDICHPEGSRIKTASQIAEELKQIIDKM